MKNVLILLAGISSLAMASASAEVFYRSTGHVFQKESTTAPGTGTNTGGSGGSASPDVEPDGFAFASVPAAQADTDVVSSPVLVTGHDGVAFSLATGSHASASYQICTASNCSDQATAPWIQTTTAGVPSGRFARIKIRSGAAGETRSAGLTAGSVTRSFDVTSAVPVVQTYSVAFSTCRTFAAGDSRTGPLAAECASAYASQPKLSGTTVQNGIQSWTVADAGRYRIVAKGASGGSVGTAALGGKGASVSGTFSLSAGDVLRVVVGQTGHGRYSNDVGPNAYGGGGGGGGSFVLRNALSNVLVAAGGGGGGATTYYQSVLTKKNGGDASTTTTGGSSSSSDGTSVPGGAAGNGSTHADQTGGGGAGALTSGSASSPSSISAKHPAANATGGGWGTTSGGVDGGFGGGGGTSNGGPGGGGGGYSGGAGGGYAYVSPYTRQPGGGGGSFVAASATSPSISVLSTDGQGSVSVEYLGP